MLLGRDDNAENDAPSKIQANSGSIDHISKTSSQMAH